MSYTHGKRVSAMGFLTPDLVTGLIAKGIDAAAGGPQQRGRARASAARTEELRRQTAEAQSAAQVTSDAVQQEAARRSAELEARAAQDSEARKKKLMMQLAYVGGTVAAATLVLWFVTRD